MKPYEAPEIQEKLALLKDAVLSVQPDTEAIYLFGSYVNGIPHEYSDFDIFVVVPGSGLNEFELQQKISNAVYDAVDRYMALDLLVNNSASFYRNLNYPSLDRIIFRTGVKIYG